jgi:hypothetical protein
MSRLYLHSPLVHINFSHNSVLVLLCFHATRQVKHIIVRSDCIGVIFMTENSSSGVCKRHIDTRYSFVNEYIDNDFSNNGFCQKKRK